MSRQLFIGIMVAVVVFGANSVSFGQTAGRGNAFQGQKTAQPAASSPSAVAKADGPAPVHDLSGIWAAVGIDQYGYQGGTQAYGAWSMPSDGKPEHEPPYTPAGLEAMSANKPGFGVREVPVAQVNDPVDSCEPRGMPRQDLYELSTIKILQEPNQVTILYTRDKLWRSVWTDGREKPKGPEPRWDGYSFGKWADDTTFVVETIGTDPRTWIDNAGRPHSKDLRVEERFHRLSRNKMELTVIIDDPTFYTKPWIAMNKMPFELRPADAPMGEQRCSPSEIAIYNQMVADPVGK